jgi:hypothetical protein
MCEWMTDFGDYHTVKLAKVEVTLGLSPMDEESLRLTAAEGTDEKGKEVCAMVVVVEEIQLGERYIYGHRPDLCSPQSPHAPFTHVTSHILSVRVRLNSINAHVSQLQSLRCTYCLGRHRRFLRLRLLWIPRRPISVGVDLPIRRNIPLA